jgi:hypothetical protein
VDCGEPYARQGASFTVLCDDCQEKREAPDVVVTGANPLRHDRVPGSVDEARTMVAYNERILATSESPQRLHRAERMLANLAPVLQRLEREEVDRLRRIADAAPPAASFEGRVQQWRDTREDEEFETVWNGGGGLSSYQQRSVE